VAHLQISKRLRTTPAAEANTGTRTHRPARPAVGNRPRLAPARPARAADQTPTDIQKSDKLTNKQTGRLTDKPIYRQTGRQTDRPTVRPTDRQTNRQTDRQTGRQTTRQTRNTIKRASRSVLEWSGRLLATATALALALRVCALGLRGCLRLRLRLSAICNDLVRASLLSPFARSNKRARFRSAFLILFVSSLCSCARRLRWAPRSVSAPPELGKAATTAQTSGAPATATRPAGARWPIGPS
jgi:hypothetical protein